MKQYSCKDCKFKNKECSGVYYNSCSNGKPCPFEDGVIRYGNVMKMIKAGKGIPHIDD